MTRRGSLAYYFCAVVCGAFFLAVCYYGHALAIGAPREHWARDFLVTYFFAILLAFAPLLLGAFLIRRLTTGLRWTHWWQWVLTGAAAFLALTWIVGKLSATLQTSRAVVSWWRMALLFLSIGLRYALEQPLWLPVPAAIATATVLYLINRAFEPNPK